MTTIECTRLLEETWIAKVESHATIPSTNDRAAELAKSATSSLPLLVIADVQTAGRGRGGNRWWTGERSLAFSVLFNFREGNFREGEAPAEPREMPQLFASCTARQEPRPPETVHPNTIPPENATPNLIGLAAGLAVVEAVRPLKGDCEIGLHWPNDVFAAGRKLAGILAEVLPDRKTILGIGLNVNNSAADAPAELQSAATTLYDLTRMRHDRISILISLLNHLKRFLDLARTSPAELAAAADAVCLQKNQRLHLQWGSTVHSGCCRGIDGRGAILLDTNEGLKAFFSGVLLKR